MRKAIFLDRDGTLNQFTEGAYITRPSELKLLEGAAEAVRRANLAGFLVILVTNQGGALVRGGASLEDLSVLHQRLIELLADKGAQLDAIKVCPHYPPEICDCRKPKAGLLIEAIKEFDIDPEQSFMVGDFDSDILAGQAAHVKTIKIGTFKAVRADHFVPNITEAMNTILCQY